LIHATALDNDNWKIWSLGEMPSRIKISRKYLEVRNFIFHAYERGAPHAIIWRQPSMR
jgi:hypothetical protein